MTQAPTPLRPTESPRQATATARRGVTLLELMVVVALLVLIMAILVEIFRSATGALTSQRAFAGIDQEIRRIDGMLRQDLGAITAKMNPQRQSNNPFTAVGTDPQADRGYFVYGENAVADAQGEDTDDYLAFTAELPAESPPFSGFVAIPSFYGAPGRPTIFQRVPITSRRAEIIYFHRNGNLYRRVFLIRPDLAGSLTLGWSPGAVGATDPPVPIFRTDTSASYGPLLQPGTGLLNQPVSWLGANDVSARPSGYPNPPGVVGPAVAPTLNGLGDLTNRENRAFTPRFSPDHFPIGSGPPPVSPDGNPERHPLNPELQAFYPTLYPQIYSSVMPSGTFTTYVSSYPQILSFPFVYPNGYSVAANLSGTQNIGPIHSTGSSSGNHAPLDLGDPLTEPPYTTSGQTWWGFPTKKETMSAYWTDPVKRVNCPTDLSVFVFTDAAHLQALCLRPAFAHMQGASSSLALSAMLPPINETWRALPSPPPFLDGYGADNGVPPNNSSTFNSLPGSATLPSGISAPEIWRSLPEDDLVMSNVRSFDVKGLDPVSQQFVDLGYLQSLTSTAPIQLFSLGHEGRIPPLTTDNRFSPQDLTQNVGDDTPSVVRLRRVWDSWSTDYSLVPPVPPSLVAPGFYPSYPPPYPVPLRGVQIQIRVVDPTNQKIKSHTLRVDFSRNLD